MILELNEARRGDWDRFQVRKIGFKLQRVKSAGKSELEQVLSLIPNVNRWTTEEKRDVARIVRAKFAREEVTYLKLMQKHEKLRQALLKLGTG